MMLSFQEQLVSFALEFDFNTFINIVSLVDLLCCNSFCNLFREFIDD